jgi:hypothetical protein
MKNFECWFPNCNYCTTSRSKIDFHHVTPREVDPSPRNKVTIPLCKTHHALIYCPEATSGQHAIKADGSLIIKGVYDSTSGKAVHFESMDGNSFYYIPAEKSLFS